MKIKITQDGNIFKNNECVGFIDDENVFVFVNGRSVEIGEYEHRSEVIKIVENYLAGR